MNIKHCCAVNNQLIALGHVSVKLFEDLTVHQRDYALFSLKYVKTNKFLFVLIEIENKTV